MSEDRHSYHGVHPNAEHARNPQTLDAARLHIRQLEHFLEEAKEELDALQAENERAIQTGHVILARLPKAERLFDVTVKDVESLEEMMNMLVLVCAEPDEEEE